MRPTTKYLTKVRKTGTAAICSNHTITEKQRKKRGKKELDSLQKYFVELTLCDTVYVIHFFFKRSNKRVRQSKVV